MRNVLHAALAAVAAVAAAAGMSMFSGPSVTQADPTQFVLMNYGLCLAGIPNASTVPIAKLAGCAINNLQYVNAASQGDIDLRNIADLLGNNNGIIEPSDFASPANFTGGQLHQQDGAAGLSHLAVIAFVNSIGPVTFHTTAGFFAESGGSIWTCDGTGTNPDSDCGGPNATSPNPLLAPDHAVVANLACTLSTCPTLGLASLTIEQNGTIFPVPFTIVGEPRTVKFFTLEKGIQAGVQNNPTTGLPDCPFQASLPAIQKALGEAEKTVLVARALDINGTAISGAWFKLTTSDPKEGVLALTEAPTLNLGGFGYGTPEILCAPVGAATGSVTVTATLERTGPAGLAVDPQADPGSPVNALAFGTVSFDVHGIPSSSTLSASPPAVPCNGTATSTVSATITDAAGNPVLSGTAVHFKLQVLGTANPIDTSTNDKGVATSVISPLAGATSGVPVTVSVDVGGVTQPALTHQILVQCTGAAAGAASGPGTAGPGASAAAGTIAAPNTGTGGGGRAGAAGLPWWPAVASVLGALGLCGLSLAVRRAR
jgi:hypothetical protein